MSYIYWWLDQSIPAVKVGHGKYPAERMEVYASEYQMRVERSTLQQHRVPEGIDRQQVEQLLHRAMKRAGHRTLRLAGRTAMSAGAQEVFTLNGRSYAEVVDFLNQELVRVFEELTLKAAQTTRYSSAFSGSYVLPVSNDEMNRLGHAEVARLAAAHASHSNRIVSMRSPLEALQSMDMDSAIRALLVPAATIDDLAMLEDEGESIYKFESALLVWKQFKDLVVSTQPNSIEDVASAQSALKANLLRLPGVELPENVDIEIAFNGNEHDGFIDAVAIAGRNRVPIEQGLRFEGNIQGLLTAFFFAAVLPTKWCWNHGLYDRDHELVVTEDQLQAFLAENNFPRKVKTIEKWPSPGIRIQKRRDRYEIRSLASSFTRGLLDLSMSVTDGRASSLAVREVYVSGNLSLY